LKLAALSLLLLKLYVERESGGTHLNTFWPSTLHC